MNTKRDGERGGWRWKAGVVGLTKKKRGGSHCGKKRGKRETENKTAKQPRMERKN